MVGEGVEYVRQKVGEGVEYIRSKSHDESRQVRERGVLASEREEREVSRQSRVGPPAGFQRGECTSVFVCPSPECDALSPWCLSPCLFQSKMEEGAEHAKEQAQDAAHATAEKVRGRWNSLTGGARTQLPRLGPYLILTLLCFPCF